MISKSALSSSLALLIFVACTPPSPLPGGDSLAQSSGSTRSDNTEEPSDGYDPSSNLEACEKNGKLTMTKSVNDGKDWCVDVYYPDHASDGCLKPPSIAQPLVLILTRTSKNISEDELTYAYLKFQIDEDDVVEGLTLKFSERDGKNLGYFEQLIERSDGKEVDYLTSVEWTNQHKSSYWVEGTFELVSVPQNHCDHYKVKFDVVSYWRDDDEPQETKHEVGPMAGELEVW